MRLKTEPRGSISRLTAKLGRFTDRPAAGLPLHVPGPMFLRRPGLKEGDGLAQTPGAMSATTGEQIRWAGGFVDLLAFGARAADDPRRLANGRPTPVRAHACVRACALVRALFVPVVAFDSQGGEQETGPP